MLLLLLSVRLLGSIITLIDSVYLSNDYVTCGVVLCAACLAGCASLVELVPF